MYGFLCMLVFVQVSYESKMFYSTGPRECSLKGMAYKTSWIGDVQIP